VTGARIRLERGDDRGASLAVERAVFGRDAEAEIAAAIADEPGSFALVAEADGAIVGHVACSRAWVGEHPVVALGPVGVVSERRGEGIGTALVRAALQEARTRGEQAVVLLGAPDFYAPLGFEPASGLGWANPFAGVEPDGFVIEEDDFQVAVLDEVGRDYEGRVQWHPAFGQAG
jgi:putative acetyltransferase